MIVITYYYNGSRERDPARLVRRYNIILRGLGGLQNILSGVCTGV